MQKWSKNIVACDHVEQNVDGPAFLEYLTHAYRLILISLRHQLMAREVVVWRFILVSFVHLIVLFFALLQHRITSINVHIADESHELE